MKVFDGFVDHITRVAFVHSIDDTIAADFVAVVERGGRSSSAPLTSSLSELRDSVVSL